MKDTNRRDFLRRSAAAACALPLAASARAAPVPACLPPAAPRPAAPPEGPRLGLVTYLWGADLGLDALIAACEAGGLGGVELRTTHAHGVEPSLGPKQRAEVKRRFADSAIEWLGIGSNENFDSPDPLRLTRAIEAAMDFLELSRDVGGTGVKVKPDSFHDGVPREQTIEQIGRALRVVGRYAAELGQELRLEVHGQCAELPTIAAILEVADQPSVTVCWNCNEQDLLGDGLEANFHLVRPRFGETLHLRAFDRHDYPYRELMDLLVSTGWEGWALLEARGELPADRGAAFARQREHFEALLAAARPSRRPR